MTKELHLEERPTNFGEIVGQEVAVKKLKAHLAAQSMPQALMFYGHSGVGKTTMARIVADKLGCPVKGPEKGDYIEINAASSRGIDTIREVEYACKTRPLYGSKCRVWVIDESQKLTPEAFSSLMKTLEELPEWSYIILCTTELESHPKTIKDRCTKFEFKRLTDTELNILLNKMNKKYNLKLSDKVTQKIIECSDGSARASLNILNDVIKLDTEDEQLDAIIPEEVEKQAIDLARMLINRKPRWPEVADLLKVIEADVEKIRNIVLKYATTVALENPKAVNRAYLVLLAFENNFWQSKKAGLVRACLEVVKDETI